VTGTEDGEPERSEAKAEAEAEERTDRVTLVVRHGTDETELRVRRGRTLRDVLVEHDLSPYTRATERVNCGGRGLCATCGVRLREGPPAEHWHDRLAARFGYPRLSCQVTVEPGMLVELVEDKLVWGSRESE
jgi:ferredoxin